MPVGKEKKWFLVVVILVIVIVLALVLKKSLASSDAAGTPYSAVYLQSGEMYVGKLTLFPKMILRDAYLITNVPDAEDSTKNNVQLQPAKNFIWSPTALYLSRQQVVFYGAVGAGSTVDEALKQVDNQ